MGTTHPADLTPAERRAEIVAILARAVLRYLARQSADSGETLSADEVEEPLEPVSEASMCGSQQEKIQ